MEHGVGMQLTPLTHLHIVVDHHSWVNDAIRANPARRADADAWGDKGSRANHRPLIHHCGGMNLRQRAQPWMKPLQRFSKGQAWIGQHRKSNAPFPGALDQIGLVGKQKSSSARFIERGNQRIALLEEAQLIPLGLL